MADPRTVLSRPAPPPDLTVAYGDHPEQVADLRFPSAKEANRPLIILVHGGFWRAGYDRTHTGPMAADLAARGYPVAQLEYRRTGQSGGGWPGTFTDVAIGVAALPALAASAADLPALAASAADLPALAARAAPVAHPAPAPPILVGHSAGGQLAMWYAAAHAAPVGAASLGAAPHAASSHGASGAPRLAGVLALAPVCDLVEAYRLDLDGGAVAALLGGGPDRVPDRYAEADPAQRDPGPTRTVVVHGVRDQQVPVAMSRRYVSRARAAGANVSLVELPDAEHFGLIDPLAPAWTTVTDVLRTLHP